MGVVMLKVVFLVLKICALAHFLVLQGSAGDSLSPSPSFPVFPPDGSATPPPVSSGKIFERSAPIPASLPKGTTVEPPPGLSPLNSAPAPQNINDHKPTSPPSMPNFSVPPPFYPNGTVPALPPSPPNGDSGQVEYPSPQVPAPLSSPSRISPQNSPMSPALVPGSLPPKSDQHMAPDAPLLPAAPGSSAPAPGRVPQNPPPTYSVMPKISPSILPVPVAPSPSNLPGSSPSIPPTLPGKPPSGSSEPDPSSAPSPLSGFNWKGAGMPVAATPNGTTSTRHSFDASSPLSSPKAPVASRFHSPASQPSSSFHRHYHQKNHKSAPSPLVYMVPPVSAGFPISPAHFLHAPSNTHESSPPSHMTPKMTLRPPFQALPPPPPNQDCTSLACLEPLTNAPPGCPCICVLPIQVGLRLNVALYNFFPLVSEFASEIAAGVFLKLSQVRIMGANAASEDPEKTIVLTDLVPLGENFDSTTAYLTFKRFWLKEVTIRSSLFGDYEVLYVRYPGLPPSPPSAPFDSSTIGSDPYSGHNNNAAALKPLGVDVGRKHHRGALNGSVIAMIVLSASVVVLFCFAIAWLLVLKQREQLCQPDSTPPVTVPYIKKSSGIPASRIGSGQSSMSMSYGSSLAAYTGSAKCFSLSDMERATDNFSETRILGEGGFGRVYSGILEDGTEVAVKVLKRADQQGAREFLAEVEMLSRLHHRNLVKLIGICTEEHTCCLVYELIPNGSVESHLHGVHRESAPLDWGARLRIALGAARGLAYLHEDSSPRVIHRDFKSSNILLEHDFTPKVSDFGLARTAMDEENKHISTRVMGTFGYVAPEYAMTGHLLVKSDVYSYGVVLLELLTSRKPVDMSQPPGRENLVTWARPLLTSKEGLESIIDPTLGPDFPFDSISKVAAIASMCVQPEVSNRPFMGEVVQALKLICNERDETKELGSRSCSREDLSVDMDPGTSNIFDHSGVHSPVSNYRGDVDLERGFSTSDLLSSSARYAMQDSGALRRQSGSGPLSAGKARRLWQKMRHLSGGTVSEHGVMFKLWRGSR